MSDANAIPVNMKRKRRTSSFGESTHEQKKAPGAPHGDYKTAKKEKKREKSEAKKARKLNDLAHRKARRNPEKYNKNKERNRILAIEAERHKIRSAAVKQCGGAKEFGTGEKETSAKPSHPEGFALAEGEQDWLALWDLNDEGLWKRIQDREKKEKKLKKEHRKKERQAAKIRKAEKRAKKAKTFAASLTAPTGVVHVDMKDSAEPKLKGVEEVVMTKAEEPKKKSRKIAGPESETESESSSESEEEFEVEEVVKPVVVESKKSKKSSAAKDQEAVSPAPKVEEAKTKKQSKDEAPVEDEKEKLKREKKERKREKKAAAATPVEVEAQENKADDETKSKEEKPKKEKKSKKGSDDKSESKKRKRSKYETEAESEVPEPAEKSTKKSKVEVSNGAEQWNPDALSGDAARKNKFLRLLGAGKGGASNDVATSKKPYMAVGTAAIDLNKIEEELEKQYTTGVKMKHDGGGKRRGLGA